MTLADEALALDLGMSPAKGDRAKTDAIYAALRRRFDPREWVLFSEVRNGDAAPTRHADAVAFNLWPARGLEIHGVEVKASRADWLAELKRPEKSAYFVERCDRWWVAAYDPKVVDPAELPKGWGLLVLRGNTLRKAVPAEARPDVLPMDRAFVSCILRHVGEEMKRSASAEALRVEFNRGFAEGEKNERQSHRFNAAEHELRNLRAAVAAFEQASGVKIADSWRAPYIGKAVRSVLARQTTERDAEKALADTELRLTRLLERLTEERKHVGGEA